MEQGLEEPYPREELIKPYLEKFLEVEPPARARMLALEWVGLEDWLLPFREKTGG